MNWIQDKHDRTIFRCSNCNSEIEVDKGTEIPGYCKHCEGETEDITEIRQVLECLGGKAVLCAECDYDTYEFTRCKERAATDVLCFIEHQQEMIDGLIAGQETLQNALAEKQSEIERLLLENEDLKKSFCGIELNAEKLHRQWADIRERTIEDLMFNLDNEISTYSSEGKDLNVYAWLKNYIKEIVGEG